MFIVATQTGWTLAELKELPISELQQYFDLSLEWIKGVYGDK